MKTKNLVGERFGNLIVAERAGSSAAGNALWNCLCDCGRTTRSAGSDLKGGRTRTCGCGSARATRTRHDQERKDLAGERFGRLLVVRYAGLNDYPRAQWECMCDCGKVLTVSQHHLSDGTTISCGCRAKDPRRRTETADYTESHRRVKFIHGPASNHACVDCAKPALDWSYDHADPNELVDHKGRPYSTDIRHYDPRCRSCHRRLDSRNAKARRVTRETATERETAS